MSGTYYTREPGPEGAILSGEGTAPGVGLDQLLELDRPPLRAALEIGSAVADILCIAAEDGHVHGDIRPAHVKVDEQGAVSIEGYGLVRRVTRAPEGQPEKPAADIYGLGLVMHASLSKEGLGNLPNDADGHDDVVVERVLAMDFSAVSTKRWLAEVREFLCKILAFDPAERPPALDAANVLATVASQCPGDDVAIWAKRAHLRQAGARPPARQVEENLAGPVALSGYFKKAEVAKDSARKAPSSKGESTAMWSREKLAALFAEEEEEEEELAPARPAAAREQSAARAREQSSAQVREDLPAARPVSAPMPAAPPKQPPAAPPAVAGGARASLGGRSAYASASPSPSEGQGSAGSRGEAPWKPQVVQPMRGPILATLPDDEPEEKATSPLMIVGVVAVVLALVCGGVVALSGGGYLFMSREPAASTEPGEAPADTLAGAPVAPAAAAGSAGSPTSEAGAAAGAANPASATAAPAPAAPAATSPGAATSSAPSAATPRASSSSGSTASSTSTRTSSGTTASTASTRPASTAAAAPATSTPATTSAATSAAPVSTATSTATYPVKFVAPGREGKIRCGDGQTAEFAGATTLSFSGTVTCLVQIDKGRGAVQVGRSTTVTCAEDAGKVTCTGGS